MAIYLFAMTIIPESKTDIVTPITAARDGVLQVRERQGREKWEVHEFSPAGEWNRS